MDATNIKLDGNKIKLIAFDLDGTLTNTLEDIADAIDDNTDAIKNQTTAMQIVCRRKKDE